MYEATKEFRFEAGHTLDGHKGKCKNLHGHNYRVLVTLGAPKTNDMDMVKDFYDIAEFAKEMFDTFDHAFIYNCNCADPFERELRDVCKRHARKMVELPFRATAENMAMFFYTLLKSELINQKADCEIVRVTVYETPTSYAVYEET